MIGEIIGGAVGLIGGIGKMFGRGAANKSLSRLQKLDPAYQTNPIAKQRMALAQQLLNSRMPGAASMERNIYSNQANTLSNIDRNATSSAQALALGSGVQGQTNQAFDRLGMQEAGDYQRRYGNLENAQQGMIQEGDKVYQDQVRRWENLAQIRGMQNANRQANWGDVSNMGFGAMNFGLGGGFQNLFGGGGGSPNGDAMGRGARGIFG